MDFKQIEAFIKVVELASFSKAAEELYISQPSVSTYISALEKELGIILINRSTKVLSATLAGERFLEQARKMVLLKRESVEMLKSLSQDISGEIRIVASSVPALYILPQLFAEFRKRYPCIYLTMSQGDTGSVVREIAEHKADIGFAGSVLGEKKCDFLEFTNEKLVFVAPSNEHYVVDKSYTLEELLYSSNFIARESGSGTRMQYEKFFSENGIELDRIKTCAVMDSTYSIVNAVASGLGVSIVSRIAARSMIAQKELLALNVKANLPERRIYMVLNKNSVQSHLLKLFIEFVAQKGSYFLDEM